jgi:hypothetical protein
VIYPNDFIHAQVDGDSVAPRGLRDQTREIRIGQVIKLYAIDFLQSMFSQHPTRTWDPDVATTKILIVDKYTFNLEEVAKRPAIVSNRGPQRWMKTSGFRQMQTRDMVSDRRSYTDLINGSVTFSVFARGGEAEDLAQLVFEWFTQFQDAIRDRGAFRAPLDRVGLFRVSSVSIGEEALVKSDSAPDLSVVPVMVQAMAQQRWLLIPRAVKLKGIRFTITRGGLPV